MTATQARSPSLGLSLVPMVLLIAILAGNLIVFGDGGLDGPNQLALLFAASAAMVIGLLHGRTFDELMHNVGESLRTAWGALLILLLIGALAGTWLIGGIVPAMISHGLALLSPRIFLVAACAVCCVVSLATGSSWSTVATVGIALMGIGTALGFHQGMIAGAVISGAYFGDKMSPLSDTTNLAPAVAGTDLFSHIRYLMLTTIPTIVITLLVFMIIGFFREAGGEVVGIEQYQEAILSKFRIGWWSYLVPLAVIGMIWRKVPALPALFIGTLLGALFAVLFQAPLIRELAGGEVGYPRQAYKVVMSAMGSGVSVVTGNAAMDELLTSGGMYGMLKTIWLILCAMVFGGAMEGAGLLQRITQALISRVKGDGSLIATTAGACVFVNVTASDQYLSIVVPGRMFAPIYKERGLDAKVLSRTLEDSGTVTSPLVPWNTCGAYMSTVLGVATFTYLPFCFFNLLSPCMTILQGALGFRIARTGAPGS